MEWLAVIIGTIAVLFTVFSRGKDAGENKADKEVLGNVAKAKKATDDVAGDDIATVRKRLRDNARK